MVVFMLGLIILNVTNAETAKKKNQLKLQKIIHLFERQNEKILSLQKKVCGGGASKNTSYMIFSDKRSRISNEISS